MKPIGQTLGIIGLAALGTLLVTAGDHYATRYGPTHTQEYEIVRKQKDGFVVIRDENNHDTLARCHNDPLAGVTNAEELLAHFSGPPGTKLLITLNGPLNDPTRAPLVTRVSPARPGQPNR